MRRLGHESGFSLIELLVAMLMSVAVIGVPMTWVITSLHQESIAASHALSAAQAQAGLAQLQHDLREVVAPSSATPTTSTLTWGSTSATATLTLPAGSQGASTQTVTWTCSFGSGGSCTRQAGANTVTMISNVQSLSFAPLDASGNALTSSATNPAYVGITLTVQNTWATNSTGTVPTYTGVPPIVCASGVDVRNNTTP